MNTWIKRSLTVIASIVVLTIAAVVIAAQLGDRKRERLVAVAVEPIAYRADPHSIERGGYLFRSRGCADCHGADGAGSTVIDDGHGLLVRSPDITPAGLAASYAPVDWVRAIRHGVKPNGQALFLMPSEDFSRLTDDDVAAVVAYARQLSPGRGSSAVITLPLPIRVLYGVGLIRDSAEKIDNALPPSVPIAEAVTAAHGAYVATGCIGCHRAGLVGGKIAGAPPSWPPAARLAPGPGSAMPRYPGAGAFAAMLKTGKRPDGSQVSKVMPFASLRELNDVDVRALHLYLTTMPPGT